MAAPSEQDRFDAASDTGSTPRPDPTLATTEALTRAIGAIHEYVDGKVELNLTRIDAETKLTAERFASIERQRIEQKADTKAAVDAALTAQKEQVREQVIASDKSIAKSEAATTKLLEQQAETTRQQNEAVIGKIDDVKERVGRIENTAVGAIAQRVETRSSNTALYALIGVLVAVVGIALTILTAIAAIKP